MNFPLLVRGPSVPEGRVFTQKLVGNHDLASTFAQDRQSGRSPFVDGTSFLRLLDQSLSNDEPWGKVLFVEHEGRKG